MGIKFLEDKKIFKLDSINSSYVIAIVDEEKFIGHVYYGKKIADDDLTYLLRIDEHPFVPSVNNRERVSFNNIFPTEYSTFGVGDFREAALKVVTKDFYSATYLNYLSYEIKKGKPKLQGLPASFGSEEDCTTLEITCFDKCINLKVILSYTVFEKLDVITRSVKVINESNDDILLEKVLSACVDFDGTDYDLITLNGSWARERHVQRSKIGIGKQVCSSNRGESSHQSNPFLAILRSDANEDYGDVYGFNFVYSGNFLAQAEGCEFDTVRVVMGINPEGFCWPLEKGECFQAPEVVMVYSDKGIGKMTRTYHDFYRQHLIRSKYKDVRRPVLINNWEATYFDFDTEKLLDIAKTASKLGIDMLVMDDGWFGQRNNDDSSLGDWFVNEEKIKGGLPYLVNEVNKLGMKFGIWFEPEMISPDSNLYKKHPDWAMQIPNRTAALCRNQYVLDLTRKEVRDCIFEMVSNILKSANIEYVKWDMNRQLTDVGSFDVRNQGEVYHRYVLGVYELMERLTTEFPNILLENCSGGGARFDPGMLYYSPQIWCSDDTDAIERLEIQRGTAMVYPLSTMGAHVSVCPNHTVGRVTPFETRGYVALAGTFGYELDITKLSKEEQDIIPSQIEMYNKYNALIRNGDYYRIAAHKDDRYDCYQVVSKDKSETLVTFIEVLRRPNHRSTRICLKGLDENKLYICEETQKEYSGSTLMYAGINIQGINKDFEGKLIYFKEK